MIIGLEPSKTFIIEQKKEDGKMVVYIKLKDENSNLQLYYFKYQI